MKILNLTITFLLCGCSVFGHNSTEQPKFKTLLQDQKFEIRLYDSYLMASVSVPAGSEEVRSKAFKKLAAFIFGSNQSQDKIKMTSPVIANKKDEQMIMSFMMPSKYTKDTLPKPNNKNIIINQTPSQTLAVLQYSGRSNTKLEAIKQKELLIKLQSSGYKIKKDSRFLFAGYNPPWTIPAMRKNEIMIEVQK